MEEQESQSIDLSNEDDIVINPENNTENKQDESESSSSHKLVENDATEDQNNENTTQVNSDQHAKEGDLDMANQQLCDSNEQPNVTDNDKPNTTVDGEERKLETEVDQNTMMEEPVYQKSANNTDEAAIEDLDIAITEDYTPIEHPEIEELDPNVTPPPQIRLEDSNSIEEEDEEEDDKEQKDAEKDEADIEETESIEEYPIFEREQLLQQYKDALEERSKIQQSNQHFQHKLAEYFKKKKTDDRGQEIEKNVTDQEQRYLKYMSNLEELQVAEARQAGSIEIQLQELKERCQEKIEKVEDASTDLIKFKYDVAKTAINSRSGKTISAKDIEQYQILEAKKEQEVIGVRLENIKLKNRLKKREMQLKAKEELAEGLHLIDFEQLKIENQTYNEKIEERNEELLKLRRKITTTVQVLTHLKEKLQFVQGENGEQRSKLRDVEVTVAQRRDVLTRIKQVRDGLRIDNNKLKHKSGLLGNTPLLRDFEVRKDEGGELCARLQILKEQHIELNMDLNGIRRKIDKSKSVNAT